MYIAYSAFNPDNKKTTNRRVSARYRGYQAACEKHRETIAQIRRYMPGWQPPFLSGGLEG